MVYNLPEVLIKQFVQLRLYFAPDEFTRFAFDGHEYLFP